MGNLADETGKDVEIYRQARTPGSIHIVSRSNAPEELLAILDSAGLERRTDETTGPVYVWHETPDGLSEKAQKQLVTRAALPLLIANYDVNIDPGLYDVTAWAQTMAAHRAQQAKATGGQAPAATPPASPGSPSRSR
ncbi:MULTISPECIES: hypothetical protein [unclassified Streptomyces]|uniref:hypothetical protein n=1 Tax=unclassified Streptomyces TaxID=2593676 RepID=UPI000DC755C3|nr:MULTISPECIES: hypothetical protein [unclassified Streptomyces]AWZ08980.1 hypothetical protein DRB89_35690 [Streptomyces sp. ICC4]